MISNFDDKGPLVSVVMASHNESPHIIGEAIESILSQSLRDFEFIIIDDSTNHDTIAKIESYSDSRMVLIKLSEYLCFPAKLNMGLQKARGRFIARMDADDIALPDRFKIQTEYLKKHDEITILGGQVNLIDGNSAIFSEKLYPLGGARLYLHSTYKSPFNHPSVMFRRNVVDNGFFYNEQLVKTSEDIDLWLRLIHSGYKIANVKEKITNYRIRDNMAKWRSSKEEIQYMYQVRKQTFTPKMLIHSTLSYFAGVIFVHLPSIFVTKLYGNMYEKHKQGNNNEF